MHGDRAQLLRCAPNNTKRHSLRQIIGEIFDTIPMDSNQFSVLFFPIANRIKYFDLNEFNERDGLVSGNGIYLLVISGSSSIIFYHLTDICLLNIPLLGNSKWARRAARKDNRAEFAHINVAIAVGRATTAGRRVATSRNIRSEHATVRSADRF